MACCYPGGIIQYLLKESTKQDDVLQMTIIHLLGSLSKIIWVSRAWGSLCHLVFGILEQFWSFVFLLHLIHFLTSLSHSKEPQIPWAPPPVPATTPGSRWSFKTPIISFNSCLDPSHWLPISLLVKFTFLTEAMVQPLSASPVSKPGSPHCDSMDLQLPGLLLVLQNHLRSRRP